MGQMPSRARALLAALILAAGFVCAQGVRSHTKPKNTGTKVSNSQAVDLTLTLADASVRPVQAWVRTAGTIDKSLKILTAYLDPPASGLVKVGQRVRAFPPESKSSMYQAWVTRVVPQGARAMVEATFSATGRVDTRYYVMEIVVDRGQFLSIPNEAIIEEGNKHVVYIPQEGGQYEPREIQTGIQGELYTQVVGGLRDGEHVVTFGSFFIDAEFKLKGTGEAPPPSETPRHP